MVLSARIKTSARTCADVLYFPLAPDPHTGFGTSSALLANSARRNSVEILENESSNRGKLLEAEMTGRNFTSVI